ncbi:MAG: 3-deoxy-D-manno-octulosonate 8-phosphate phosphatase [Flavobacteriales bacterium]|nr:3-deoxy-D-manno-octulosonate 8-phosphate phosphatase [Flavobacteriales bacterium]|tara:strand:+ start:46488 stop:47012 length:525 start_codon:yes stop_codon:yes gene_type:complete
MAENLKAKFRKISAFIFDVDGVLTDGRVITMPDGDQLRSMNIKDGYALQHAVKKGYHISIISGGKSESVRLRLEGLGISEVNLACKNKVEVFEKLKSTYDLKDEQILYMGDDIPDYRLMKKVGFAACPKDAATEIKEICHYISPKNGGEGCVRELIEQVMRLQGKWFDDDSHEW